MTHCNLRPMEFNVVVKPDATEEKTPGGIILTTQTVDADKLASDNGVIVALSPLAFSYAEWPEGTVLPKVGDRVVFARYAGTLRKAKPGTNEEDLRILKDKDIMAVIEPASVPLAAVA